MNKVSIVGVGPGAVDLLTIRALNRIKDADVILWADSLIPAEIANLTNKNCEKIATSSLTLEEILSLLIIRYEEGKKVVRLHDGDPCLYGAISEQICILTDKGIEVEVIPGVSAYQAAASSLKSELTIPNEVQTIILSRAKGRTNIPDNESLEKLAAIKASLCLYLSARHVQEVQDVLLQHYPAKTTVAICYRVSWKDEFIKLVPLNEIANTTKINKLIRTTLYIISPAFGVKNKRSKLYSPDHSHLFRQVNES